MRDFTYREPRFLASATFHFRTGETTVPGVCTNVSTGGLSALIEPNERSGEPEVGENGSLVLRYPQQQFTLGAVVTHLDGKEVGFSFVQRNEKEKLAAEEFAAFLEAHKPRPVGRHVD